MSVKNFEKKINFINKRKYFPVKQVYSKWAKHYDTEKYNLLIFLEEKSSKQFFGEIKGKEILDFGCGTGRYTIPLVKKGANVTAIDFTPEMIKRAKEKARKEKLKINFITQDITKYESNKKFDLIISMLVLDHVKNLKGIVDIMNKASRIGTKIVISNLHPIWPYQNYIKSGKNKGFITLKHDTDQYYHPVGEYLDLFYKKGFMLTKLKDLNFEKKYWEMKRFKAESRGADLALNLFKDKPVGIIMGFEKIK